MVEFPHIANLFLHNPRLFHQSHQVFNLIFLLCRNQLISVLSRVLERQSKLLDLWHLLLCAPARYRVLPENNF
jgi:hypothetical protein